MDKLKEVRASLTALTNAGGVDPAFGSVDIDAKINKAIVDASPKFSEIRNMVPRESMEGQITDNWRVRISDNESTVAGYSLSEAGTNTNTPLVGGKVLLTATAVSVRTDWEVENFFLAGSASAYNALADELMNAVEVHADKEERMIINGADTGSYGIANSFLGLKQLVSSFVTIGDTTSVYGVTRASGKGYMDAQVVDGDTSAFAITDLDKALTAQKKVKGKAGYFLMSYDRIDEVNSKLQAQQRFLGTLDIEGGFTISTYKAVPLVGSMYADKLGALDTDTRILLIAADNVVMKVLHETSNEEVDLGRYDSKGGVIKTYEVLKVKDLTKNVVIDDILVPSY